MKKEKTHKDLNQHLNHLLKEVHPLKQWYTHISMDAVFHMVLYIILVVLVYFQEMCWNILL